MANKNKLSFGFIKRRFNDIQFETRSIVAYRCKICLQKIE